MRLKSSERLGLRVGLTSSSSCSTTETLPSPVGPTSFSRRRFSGCRVAQGHFHRHKTVQSPLLQLNLRANTSSPRLSSELQDQVSVSVCVHVLMCVCYYVCVVSDTSSTNNLANENLAGWLSR